MNPVILRRTLFWFPFAVALAGAVYLLLRPESIPVDIGTVSRGVLTITVGDEGRTRVRDVFELSAPLTGRQRRIAFEVGDTVVAGKTVVVRIEPTDPGFLDVRSEASAEAAARAAVAARSLAEAELRRAQTELEFARSE